MALSLRIQGPKVIKLFSYSFSDLYSVLEVCAPLSKTEYDTKNRGYKSFGLRSPLNLIWSTYSNTITYGVALEIALKMHEFRELQSQTD